MGCGLVWEHNAIKGNFFTENDWYGITSWGSGDGSNNLVQGNTITHTRSGYGVEIYDWEHNNTFKENNIRYNNRGVKLDGTSGCTFTGNNITGNKYGCWIGFSSRNTFKENNVLDNSEYGMYLRGSEWNDIYRNDFLGNEVNAKEEGVGVNMFDSRGVGNYWDDYDGGDADGDGIGDTPYEIPGDGDSKDAYPVMHPFRVPERPSHRRDLWVTLAIGGGIGMGVVIIAAMVYRHKKKQDQDDSEWTPQPFRV